MPLRKNKYVSRKGVGAKKRHRVGSFKMGRGRTVKGKKTVVAGRVGSKGGEEYEKLLELMVKEES